MYYSAIKDEVRRVMSAVSSDALNWVREQGCASIPGVRVLPIRLADQATLLFTTMVSSINIYGQLPARINIGRARPAPLVTGHYFKVVYTRKPGDPAARMDNAPVVMTPDGLRA